MTRPVAATIWEIPRWSPYAALIGIGVRSWFALLSDNSCSGHLYAKIAGMLEGHLRGRVNMARRTYYRENPPDSDWGGMQLDTPACIRIISMTVRT